MACSVPLQSSLRFCVTLCSETIRGARYEAMRGKRSPRGPWIVLAALALVLGVGLLSPAWAADPSKTDDTGGQFVPPPKGNSPGPGGSGGGEADPDWWQTDGWAGTPIGALPAHEEAVSRSVNEPYRVVWIVQGSLEAIKVWLSQLSSHRLGM
jgi:hypothetical protein